MEEWVAAATSVIRTTGEHHYYTYAPDAEEGFIDNTLGEDTSILKLIESVFGLPQVRLNARASSY